MRKMLLAAALAAAMLPAPAGAEMVTARWGVKGAVQHAGTVRYDAAEDKTTLLLFDLSALPKGAEVYRARLFFAGVNWKEKGFDIVPARRRPAADPKAAKIEPAGKRLEVVGPWNQWLDATEAVRGWAKTGRKAGMLWMRSGRSFDRDRTVLEIAYEGKPAGKLPPQVTGVEAVRRSGQVFITFKETDPPDGGKDEITVAELSKRMSADYYRPVRTGPLAYRVYRHDRPITADDIGQAELLGVVLPGSAYNTRIAYSPTGRRPGMTTARIGGKAGGGEALALRVAVRPAKKTSADGKLRWEPQLVPPGTGVYVHTVAVAGKAYYAVLAASAGVVNATEISRANTAGPVQERPGEPDAVLYRDVVIDVGGGAAYHQQWYSFWAVQPMSPWPARYDVVVQHCPAAMAKPAPLYIYRHGWNVGPRAGRAGKISNICVAHNADQPVDFRLGLHDSIKTIKGFDQGVWKPFHSTRQRGLVAWLIRNWPIDRNRIHVAMAAWGMWEIKDADLYAYIHGWGQPELTKGFQCWDRARSIWGTPEMYAGRPDDQNPYVACNFTDWVLKNPTRELPFYVIHAGGGSHYREMGWPPQPKFCWAMMQAKQPFVFSTARSPAGSAAGRFAGRRDRSVPAFANCTLDDNIGEGDIRSGNGWDRSQVNGYVMWDSETITDAPDRWEITVWVDGSSFHDDCTVDLTPRRCRKFKARKGRKFAYTNTLIAPPPPAEGKGKGEKPPATAPAARVVQKGHVQADEHGLVTIRGLKVTKGTHRIAISAK